ncbi:MAG: DMT family transporter [Phototrophicaceae bacterium]
MSDSSLAPTRLIPISVYVMLALGLSSFAFSSILVRLAQSEGLPSLYVAAMRLALGAVILTPIVLMKHRSNLATLTRRDLLLTLVAGLFLALHFISWVTSLEYTSVLISVVFVTSSPLWVAILEYVFLKSSLPKLVIAGLGIAIIGGILIGFGGTFAGGGFVDVTVDRQRELIGGLLSLIGAITIAVYLIIARKLQQPRLRDGVTVKLHIIPYIWLVYGTAGLILLVWGVIAGVPLIGYSTQGYIWILLMTLFPQLIGHSSLNYAVGYLPATIVSMLTQLEPIGSAILAYFLFGELPFPLQIVGSFVIITGVMVATYGQNQKRKKSLA